MNLKIQNKLIMSSYSSVSFDYKISFFKHEIKFEIVSFLTNSSQIISEAMQS